MKTNKEKRLFYEEEKDGSNVLVRLHGRLDSETAGELDTYLNETSESTDSITINIADLQYISSAGLRLFLTLHKKMMSKGGMRLLNPQEHIVEIFEVTGFSSCFDIEE